MKGEHVRIGNVTPEAWTAMKELPIIASKHVEEERQQAEEKRREQEIATAEMLKGQAPGL